MKSNKEKKRTDGIAEPFMPGLSKAALAFLIRFASFRYKRSRLVCTARSIHPSSFLEFPFSLFSRFCLSVCPSTVSWSFALFFSFSLSERGIGNSPSEKWLQKGQAWQSNRRREGKKKLRHHQQTTYQALLYIICVSLSIYIYIYLYYCYSNSMLGEQVLPTEISFDSWKPFSYFLRRP